MQLVCPICKSQDGSILFNSRDNLVTGEKFGIVDCPGCGLRFTHPFPDVNVISRYYESEEYYSHMEDTDSFFSRVYSAVRNFALKGKVSLIEKYALNSPGKILDIGCGTGEFLGKMKDNSWIVKGVDASESAREIAWKRNGIEVLGPNSIHEFDSGEFDVISMWHSLEHFHDPGEYLSAVSRSLSENGLLVVAVPNYRSVDGEYYKENWAAYDVPRHLYHFSKDTVLSLVSKYGFTFKSLKAMPFDPFYISILSEKHRNGSFLNGVVTGARSWFKALIKPESSSSVIYLFKKDQNK